VTGLPAHTLRIERTFAAPVEEVFDAWTSPEVMRRWFHCEPDWDTPEAEVDLRVGGKIRVVMRRPDGSEIHAQGEFTLIERPHRLVMTWTFSDDPVNEQLLELSFTESAGATTVLLATAASRPTTVATGRRRAGKGASTSSTGWSPAKSPYAGLQA
jgi:uncharacterized protein YndB with AHSA1/START domain